MTTIELKKALFHRVTEINNGSFLKAIKTIPDTKTESVIIALTEEQRNEIIDSKKEIEQGLYMEHELFDKKDSTWLSAK